MIKNELIFDIGANKGCFSKKCLEIYSEPKIIMVEANDELANNLKNNFASNNIVVLNNLVSTNSGEKLNFFVSNADTISTASKDWIEKSRFANKYEWYNPIEKESINLDELVSIYGSPSLIKIDVEGYELEVIKGLTKKQSEICFEWAEEEYHKVNEVCKYLENLG